MRHVNRKLRVLRSPMRAALFAGTIAVGVGAVVGAQTARADEPSLSMKVQELLADFAPAKNLNESLAPLINKVRPAVVSIRAYGGKRMGFGPKQGVGSGFVIEKDGLAVTNHHVVDGAERLEVRTEDGRRFEADVLGTDPQTDLAVIKLRGAKSLPTVKLGKSQHVEVGDFVIAIGSPMGLESTVTRGIVSAKGRGDLGLYRNSYVDFIQTDAAISPGSSGGPLVNMRGQVVAVNTAVAGPGRGLGFAVPVDQARWVIPQLTKYGKVTRGWLGIAGRDVEPAFGAAPELGAEVGTVYERTPAEKGGLRKGDRVVEIDGERIDNFAELRAIVGTHSPGDTVKMKVVRGSSTETLKVKLGTLPDGEALAALGESKAPAGRGRGLWPDGSRRLGVEVAQTKDGLRVQSVADGSVADQLGMRKGDLLEEVNGVKIKAVGDVARALGKSGTKVTVKADRNGATHVGTLQRR